MPDLAESVAKKVGTVGELGRELAAIRKALNGPNSGGATATGITTGVQEPPQRDNEAGDKDPGKAPDPAQPKVEEDIDDNDAPEIIGAKELTPAQKSARDLAMALGVHPDLKVGEKGAIGKGITHLTQKVSGNITKIGGKVTKHNAPHLKRIAHLKKGKKSAEELAEEFYLEQGTKAKFPIGKVLQGTAAAVGAGAGGLSIADFFRRRKQNNRGKLSQIQEILAKEQAETLASEFYLERGEKALPPGLAGLGRRVVAGARKVGGLVKDEIRRQPLQTAIGAGVGAASAPLIYEQTRNAQRQKKLFSVLGLKEKKSFGSQIMLKAGTKFDDEAPTAEASDEGDAGSMDPSEMQGLRQKLDLTPLEAELFDQLMTSGEGLEGVDAGMPPEPIVEPAPEAPAPGTPRADNLPSNGQEMYGQSLKKAPAQDKLGEEAVQGQGPTDTNPAPDLDAEGVDRPESASYQSDPTGSETSEAPPEMGTEMAQMLPGATRATVQPPPMSRDEARQEGQTEEEAFASLVAKLERAQE